MNAVLNDNAAGVWLKAVGTPVEVVEPGANRLHCRIRMPDDAPIYAGRVCTIATRWLDIERPVCPTCGRPLED